MPGSEGDYATAMAATADVEIAAAASSDQSLEKKSNDEHKLPEYNAASHFFLKFVNDNALERPIPESKSESLTHVERMPKRKPNSRIVNRTRGQSEGILPDMCDFRQSTLLLLSLGRPNECEYSASMDLEGDSVLMEDDLVDGDDYYQFRRFIVECKITVILDEVNKVVHFVAPTEQLLGDLADSPHKYPVKVLGRIDVEPNAANQIIGGSIKVRVARAHRDTDDQAYVACCAYEMDWTPPADFQVPCESIKKLADRYVVCWFVTMRVPSKKGTTCDSWSTARFRIAIRNTTKGDNSTETVNIECEDPISASDFVRANTILAWYYDHQLQKYTKLRPLLSPTKHTEALDVAEAQGISATQIRMLQSLQHLQKTKEHMHAVAEAVPEDDAGGNNATTNTTKTTLDDDQRRQLCQWLSEYVITPRLNQVLAKGKFKSAAKSETAAISDVAAQPAPDTTTTPVAADVPVVEDSCRLTPPNSPAPSTTTAHSPEEGSPRRSPRRRNSQAGDGPGQKSTRLSAD
jgi:hypothetical protein